MEVNLFFGVEEADYGSQGPAVSDVLMCKYLGILT